MTIEEKEFPLVCLCIPTYNVASTVLETIKSLLSQTYPNLVLHVSDNASTDDTLALIQAISDPRVVIHKSKVNVGGEENFSRCIKFGCGKYTAIFHADDVYEPEMVAKQVAFLEENADAAAVFTEANLIDENGLVIGEIRFPQDIKTISNLYNFSTIFKVILRESNFFICPSAMVKTSVYQDYIKGWRGDLFKSSADLDVWLRILFKHSIGYLPEKLMRYRISSNQYSAKIRLETGPADFFLVTEHYLQQDLVKAQLTSVDFRNYKWLERRDRVMRAVNLFIANHYDDSICLLDDVLSWDALHAAIITKRGLLVLIVGLYLKFILFIGIHKLGKSSLACLKQIFFK